MITRRETLCQISGFPAYWISDQGRVYSGMEQRSPGGYSNGFETVIHNRPMRELKRTSTRNGYHVVGLYNADGMHWTQVHHLVLGAFVEPKPFETAITRHLNGDKSDNRPVNLAWGTNAENAQDRMLHGTQTRGESHGCAKLTEADVREIRSRAYYRGLHQAQAKQYGISADHIRQIWQGTRWSHIQ